MLAYIKSTIKKLPVLNGIVSERDNLRTELAAIMTRLNGVLSERDGLQTEFDSLKTRLTEVVAECENLQKEQASLKLFVPPGHFYSPIPSLLELQKDEAIIFGDVPSKILGVELSQERQRALLEEFVAFYNEMPFTAEKQEGLRYFFENPAYSYSDGILLHCMIRHLKPQRIIEVGSGFSSCMTLDTNELYFGGSIETLFIEPYPELLMSLIKDTDKGKIEVIPTRLQDIDLELFDGLRANDILFIDSTHVSKINSDVNRIMFDILPRLSPGVHVHFHDIFFPFEYPREWAYEGRAWNEAYLLRAFLQYNNSFSIVLMNTFMERFCEALFEEKMPLCLKNPGGSIWIRKN